MILGVVSQQLLGSSGPAPVVTPEILYRGSSNTDIQDTGGTTTTVTLPASVTTGDMMLFWVMHRDAITSVTSGWTLLFGPTEPFLGTSEQRQSVYYKVSDGTEASTTISATQATAERMNSHAQVFYSTTGEIEVYSVDGEARVEEGLTLPELPAAVNRQMAAVSMTDLTLGSTSANVEWTPPDGYTLTTPTPLSFLRQGCAYKSISYPEVTEGVFTLNYTGTVVTTNRTAISVILTYPIPPIAYVDSTGNVLVDGSGNVITVQ